MRLAGRSTRALVVAHERVAKLRAELLAIDHKASPESAAAWDAKLAALNEARDAFSVAAECFVATNGSDILTLATGGTP